MLSASQSNLNEYKRALNTLKKFQNIYVKIFGEDDRYYFSLKAEAKMKFNEGENQIAFDLLN